MGTYKQELSEHIKCNPGRLHGVALHFRPTCPHNMLASLPPSPGTHDLKKHLSKAALCCWRTFWCSNVSLLKPWCQNDFNCFCCLSLFFVIISKHFHLMKTKQSYITSKTLQGPDLDALPLLRLGPCNANVLKFSQHQSNFYLDFVLCGCSLCHFQIRRTVSTSSCGSPDFFCCCCCRPASFVILKWHLGLQAHKGANKVFSQSLPDLQVVLSWVSNLQKVALTKTSSSPKIPIKQSVEPREGSDNVDHKALARIGSHCPYFMTW